MKIPDKSRSYWLRWFCMPPAVFAVFISLGLGLSFVTSALHIWFEPVGGFILAGVWVLIAYLMAPDHKAIVSVLAFAAGAALAWKLIGRSWWPEGYAKAYQTTHIPLISTLTGGLVVMLFAIWNENRRNRTRQIEDIVA